MIKLPRRLRPRAEIFDQLVKDNLNNSIYKYRP
ncbi:MAG: hypothetical protein ACFWTT_02995 [Lactobacillus delbrueckii]